MSVRFHPEVDDDVIAGFIYCNNERAGLGEEFIDAIDRMAARLADKLTHRALPGYERDALMGRFPHRFLYCFDDDDIVVLAVAHDRRHPDYWAHRLSG